MPTVLLRTFVIYCSLELSMKLMGKRQIGEFQLSEFVTTLFISELASLPITDPDIPLTYVMAPLILIISLEVITTFISLKSIRLKRFFSGKPSIIIHKGVIDQKELAKLRISLSEFLGQLRQKGISDIEDVNYAIIEDDGMLSVFPKKDKRPPNIEDVNDRKLPDNGIAHSLVIDGEIIDENLKASGVSKKYIENELKKAGISLKDVFLFSRNDSGSNNIVKKDGNK